MARVEERLEVWGRHETVMLSSVGRVMVGEVVDGRWGGGRNGYREQGSGTGIVREVEKEVGWSLRWCASVRSMAVGVRGTWGGSK